MLMGTGELYVLDLAYEDHQNGDVPGSIYGTAVFMERHMVVMYGLTDVMVARSNPLLTNLQSLDDLPGFEDFSKFSSSLKYRDEVGSSGGK